MREVEGSILILKLNRPEKQNALTREMYQDLANAINEAHGDFGIRSVVITTTSGHFTAGNDLFDFLNDPPIEPGSPVMNFLEAVHNFAKPLIAAVTGNAVGIGTTMLFHCDYVTAHPNSRFSMPFVSLGLVPEAGSSLLFPSELYKNIFFRLIFYYLSQELFNILTTSQYFDDIHHLRIMTIKVVFSKLSQLLFNPCY